MPGGDEAHMRAGEQIDDLLDRFFGGGRTDRGQGARAQPFGHFQPHLDLGLGPGLGQRLRIGVGDDEIDAFELLWRSCC
jgi:hypothetical protein